MTTPAAPKTLIDAHGRVTYGRFADSLQEVNGRDARLLTPMGRPTGRLGRYLRYKQFQYYGLISQRFLIGCALADTAWLGVIFVYLYDRMTGQLHEWNWKTPFARHLELSRSPRQGRSRFKRGDTCLMMHYIETPDGLEKQLCINMPTLSLQATMREPPTFEPLSLCTRNGVNGFMYANKVAGIRAEGSLLFKGQRHLLDDLDCYGHHDFSAGFAQPTSWWNWACSSASVNGHRLGFNLSAGINETGRRENCLWLDGQLISIGGVHFEYEREDIMAPWRLHDNDNRIALRFTPAGVHKETLNAGLFASNFHQLFGHFDGHIWVGDTHLELSAISGFTEEQYVKW